MPPVQPADSVMQADKNRKQKYWGMGLLGLGIVLELLFFFTGLRINAYGGLILMVIGLVWLLWRRGTKPVKRTWGWIDSLGLVAIIGALAIIAISSWIKHEAEHAGRIFSMEAKVNLGGIHTTAMALKEETGTFFISDINQFGFRPGGQLRRYSLWYSANGTPQMIPGSSQVQSPCDVTTPPTTVKVAASKTGFTAAAKGNIDSDATCDEWSINDAKELKNTLNDVNK